MNLNQQKPKQQEQQEKQQFKQQRQQQEETTIKCPVITVEKLREYPRLLRLSDVEAENIIDSLIQFSQLTYEIFMQQQTEATNCNKSEQQGATIKINSRK